jgi:FADH2 O2-dependent halogenase
MMTTAVKYGATVHQNCPVEAVAFNEAGVTILPKGGDAISANYVVDAGGGRSVLAQQFEVRDTHLQTHSRGMFTHMTHVPAFHTQEKARYDLPFRMAEGTLHHLFDGGWLWVIPFDNHPESTNPLCSVGLLLDPRQHPPRPDLTAEQEFYDFIAQYPDIATQFAGATAVRQWTRASRLQYTSKQVVGDRWALLGHAAGFIDPLFSKGLYAAMSAVFVQAHLLLQAKQTGDYSATAFAQLETMSQNQIRAADCLIANSYRSFAHPDLWRVYAVVWLLGAYTELLKLNMMRAQAGDDRQAYYDQLVTLKLVGGGFTEFEAITNQADALMAGVDVGDEGSVARVNAGISQILRQLHWIPDPFIALLDGKTHLPKNKIRLSLLKPNNGFMGKGNYKAHFFGNLTLRDLLRYGIREKVRYARPILAWQHKKQFRQKFGKRII